VCEAIPSIDEFLDGDLVTRVYRDVLCGADIRIGNDIGHDIHVCRYM
jgi:hypothetical protein